MTNIDDLMQHKFDNDDPNSRFEFREEYWEQALALIEADEARRRKKRRWLWWWCLAGLMLATAGFGIWKAYPDTIASDSTNDTEKLLVTTTPQTQRQDGGQPPVGTQIEAGQPKPQPPAGSSRDENVPNGIERPSNHEKNRKSQFNSSSPYLTNSKLPANTGANASNKASGSTPSSTAPLLPSMQAVAAKDSQSQANQPLPYTNTGTNTTPSAGEVPDTIQTFAMLPSLPLPLDTVHSQRATTQKKLETVAEKARKQTKPIRESRFRMGLSGAAAAYQPAPDKRKIGFAAGLHSTYKLSSNWSAIAGLGLRFQPGNWQDTAGNIQTESLKYSFGFELEQTRRRDVGLLCLEIPVGVAWRRGVMSAEAGIAPGRLLAALERYEETKETSLQSPRTTLNRLEKGDAGIFQKYYANAFVGMEWRCTKNASINLRGNYRIGSIVKATPGEPAIKGGSSLELGLRWTIGL